MSSIHIRMPSVVALTAVLASPLGAQAIGSASAAGQAATRLSRLLQPDGVAELHLQGLESLESLRGLAGMASLAQLSNLVAFVGRGGWDAPGVGRDNTFDGQSADPADSLYRAGQVALNRGDFQAAGSLMMRAKMRARWYPFSFC